MALLGFQVSSTANTRSWILNHLFKSDLTDKPGMELTTLVALPMHHKGFYREID